MRKRKEKDIWQGLYEFVFVENSSSTDFDRLEHPILHNLKGERINIEIVDKKLVHVLTHQNLNVNFAIIDLDDGHKVSEKLIIDEHQWYTLQDIEKLPKPILISNFLDTYLN
jgi:A/G-specific adenine glycosylase